MTNIKNTDLLFKILIFFTIGLFALLLNFLKSGIKIVLLGVLSSSWPLKWCR